MISSQTEPLFEKVVVINLDRDAERLSKFYAQLPEDWPFPYPERFPAVDGSRAAVPTWWQAGAAGWGCFRSHQSVIETALLNGIESILVLEDDATLVPDFRSRWELFAGQLPADWEWLYLGGQHIQCDRGLPMRITENVYRPFNVHRAHAYGFRGRRVMELVHNHLLTRENWGEKNHIDHRLGELHQDFPGGIYVPDRWLVGQAAGFSNIKRKQLEANFFPDTRWLLEAPITQPMVAVVGRDTMSRLRVAATLHCLGVSMGEGAAGNSLSSCPDSYCAPGLDSICRNIASPRWLRKEHDFEFRCAHLRMWASRRGARNQQQATLLGGTHTALNILAWELSSAWDQPTVVVVNTNSEKLALKRGDEIARMNQIERGLSDFDDAPLRKIIQVEDSAIAGSRALINQLVDELGLATSQAMVDQAMRQLTSTTT